MGTATATKRPTGEKLGFYIFGDGMTRIARDLWQEREDEFGFEWLKNACIGMNSEQAELILTGKAKLVGDSRLQGDDGIKMVADDTKNHLGMPLLTRAEKRKLFKDNLAKARLRIKCLEEILGGHTQNLASPWGLVKVPDALLKRSTKLTSSGWVIQIPWEEFEAEFPGLVDDARAEAEQRAAMDGDRRRARQIAEEADRRVARIAGRALATLDGKTIEEATADLQSQIDREPTEAAKKGLMALGINPDSLSQDGIPPERLEILQAEMKRQDAMAAMAREKPRPDSSLGSVNGWILPDGSFYGCPPMGHRELSNLMGADEDRINTRWVRVQDRYCIGYAIPFERDGDFPTLKGIQITQAQLNTIDRWCKKHKRPVPGPDEYEMR